MSEDMKPSRIPPPAFPPGARRHQAGTGSRANRTDGFSSRDDTSFELISPDEPLPPRAASFEEGMVTSLGDDPHLGSRAHDHVSAADPIVRDLTVAVAKLAESLRRRGEAGLHASPEMSRFEATLRAYCVGYLAGRRADEGAGREPTG